MEITKYTSWNKQLIKMDRSKQEIQQMWQDMKICTITYSKETRLHSNTIKLNTHLKKIDCAHKYIQL